MDTYVHYLVTTAGGGSIEVSLLKRHLDEDKDERASVAHAAWRKLFDSDKDAFGNRRTGADRNNAPVMLKKLCDKMGSKKAHEMFTAAIQYERVR